MALSAGEARILEATVRRWLEVFHGEPVT